MKLFKLPDLGEGLPEAELVVWHVAVGDTVARGAPMVSVETAKAIVEIPSPEDGRIARIYGQPGDIIHTGDPLLEFAGDGAGGGDGSGDSADLAPDESAPTAAIPTDAGTVVGEVTVGREVVRDRAIGIGAGAGVGGSRTTPAVRALAHRLDVDLSIVTPSGPDSLITAMDVERVAQIMDDVGPLEPLRGVRRTMARIMAQAHAEVVAVTISDDADIDAWTTNDVSLRLIRALVAGCKAEPSLNAWYDSHALGRRIREPIDLGIAIDTSDGLFVPVLRDVANRDEASLRAGLDAMKQAVRTRKIPPDEMRGYTLTLSNFGTFAGRYADPIVVPPTVAILGAGKIRPEVVAVDGAPAVHRILPLSLTFDHRSVTGGEAARFLAVVLADLAEAE